MPESIVVPAKAAARIQEIAARRSTIENEFNGAIALLTEVLEVPDGWQLVLNRDIGKMEFVDPSQNNGVGA